MAEERLLVLLLLSQGLLPLALVATVGHLAAWSIRRAEDRRRQRTAPHPLTRPRAGRPGHPEQQARPLEEIARDLRRLAPRVHQPPPGTSRAKLEGLRHAYDQTLGEAAAALDVVHLLGVLEPGPELDAERSRVETRLWLAGLRIDETA